MLYLIMHRNADSSYHPDYGLAYKMAEQVAAQSDPEDQAVYIQLAEASYKTSNRGKAIECQKRCIQLLEERPNSLAPIP